MSTFSAAIVTYIDSDTPFQWGLELERVTIPMVVFTSAKYKDQLEKVKNSHVIIRPYFSDIFRNTTFEKLLLLDRERNLNGFKVTHLYWLDPEYLQSSLSFEFLYSDILHLWLAQRHGEFQVFYHDGYRHDMFFGGPIELADKLLNVFEKYSISNFRNIQHSENNTPGVASELVEFDHNGINGYVAEVVTDPVLHIVGDSHSLFCLTPLKAIGARNNVFVNTKEVSIESIPYKYQFTHHLGSNTMFTFSKGELVTDYLLKRWNIKAGDFVLYVFGEIDVRCHVWKQVKENGRELDEVVDSLAKDYINYIAELGNSTSSQTGVFGVMPPLEPVNYGDQHKPIYGTIEERVEATKLLNQKLGKYATDKGIYYVDFYSIYASSKGDLPREISDSFCHLSHFHKQPGLNYFYSNLNNYLIKQSQFV